jgi:hypothetical protein
VRGRDRRLQISGVDDLATYNNIANCPGTQVPDPLTVTPAAHVLMAEEHAYPARLREPRGRLSEVPADLTAGRPFVVPGVLADLVDPVLAKGQRIHSVVRGGGMEANERIRVQPMTSRGVSAVNHGYRSVALRHQRVGEGQTTRARPDDQIIGFDSHVSAPVCGATSPPSGASIAARDHKSTSFGHLISTITVVAP